ALQPGFFQRLWQQLHGDPRRLPYSWAQREDRLSCRLAPVPPGQEQWVESERVADRPDVELRIVTPPRRPSRLVEVVFPASTTIGEAKAFVYQEVGAASVHAHLPTLRWVEAPERITLELG